MSLPAPGPQDFEPIFPPQYQAIDQLVREKSLKCSDFDASRKCSSKSTLIPRQEEKPLSSGKRYFRRYYNCSGCSHTVKLSEVVELVMTRTRQECEILRQKVRLLNTLNLEQRRTSENNSDNSASTNRPTYSKRRKQPLTDMEVETESEAIRFNIPTPSRSAQNLKRRGQPHSTSESLEKETTKKVKATEDLPNDFKHHMLTPAEPDSSSLEAPMPTAPIRDKSEAEPEVRQEGSPNISEHQLQTISASDADPFGGLENLMQGIAALGLETQANISEAESNRLRLIALKEEADKVQNPEKNNPLKTRLEAMIEDFAMLKSDFEENRKCMEERVNALVRAKRT